MAGRKKFRVPKLNPNKSFAANKKIILAHYLKKVFRQAKEYQREKSAEILHQLRIALRRFRYVFELYAPLIKAKHFKEIYELTVALQNALGEKRDADVMHERLLSIYRGNAAELPDLIAVELERSKLHHDMQIEEQLHKFLRNSRLIKFLE